MFSNFVEIVLYYEFVENVLFDTQTFILLKKNQ